MYLLLSSAVIYPLSPPQFIIIAAPWTCSITYLFRKTPDEGAGGRKGNGLCKCVACFVR